MSKVISGENIHRQTNLGRAFFRSILVAQQFPVDLRKDPSPDGQRTVLDVPG